MKLFQKIGLLVFVIFLYSIRAEATILFSSDAENGTCNSEVPTSVWNHQADGESPRSKMFYRCPSGVVPEGSKVFFAQTHGDSGTATCSGSVCTDSSKNSQSGTGTLTTSGTTAVTGTGTSFITELQVGRTITAAGQTKTIDTIISDTSFTTTTAFSPNLSSSSFTYSWSVDEWVGNNCQPYKYVDSGGNLFNIASNTATAVTVVSGSPSSGAYRIVGMCGPSSEHYPPQSISLTVGTTYYFGAFFKFERIDGVDIWRDTGVDLSSHDKLIEIQGNVRALIHSGFPDWSSQCDDAGNPCDHKMTYGYYLSPAYCTSCIYEQVEPNVSPYSRDNILLMNPDIWQAVVLGYTPSDGSTQNGRIQLWINGIKTTDYQNIKTQNSSSPYVDHFYYSGTVAQGAYDAPKHNRYMDYVVLSDAIADVENAGLMQDPELARWCITEPDDTISSSYTTASGTNSALVVFLPYYNHLGSTRASSVTWGNTSLTRVSGTSGTPPGDYTTEIWVAALGENHTGATNTLTVTFPSYVYGCALVRQFNGINQTTTAHGGTAYDTEDDGAASLTVSNVITTDTVIGAFIKADGAGAYTSGSNQAALEEFRVPNLMTRRVLATSKSGVNGGTLSATFGSTYHGGAAVALKPASPVIPVGTTNTDGCVADDDDFTESYTTVSGTNSTLVVFMPYASGSGTAKVSTMTWGGTTLNRISGTSGTTPGDHTAEIWIAPLGASHTAATNTLSVTFTGSVYGCAIISQFDNVDQTTPAHDGTATNSTQEGGTAALTVSDVATTDLLIGAFTKADGSNAYTLGAGQYSITEFQVPNLTTRRVLALYKATTNGGTVSATFGSTYHGGAAAALKKAP